MLFKDMTNAALWDAYRAQRALNANADGITTLHAQTGNRRAANRGVGMVIRGLKNLDIIVAIARKRGVNLLGERPAE